MSISIQTNIVHVLAAGSPTAPTKTDSEIAAFAAAFGVKVTALLSDAGLIRDNSVPGQVDFVAAPPTYTNPGGGSNGVGIDTVLGVQWYKLGGSRETSEPVNMKLEYILRRFYQSSTVLHFSMHLRWSVSTFPPSMGFLGMTFAFTYQNSSSGVSGTSPDTYEACVRDNSFTMTLGVIGSQTANQGFFHVERLMEPDGLTIPEAKDQGVLVGLCTTPSAVVTRYWVIKTWNSTASGMRSYGCCPAPVNAPNGSTPNGVDNFVYPAIILGPPFVSAPDILAYNNADPFTQNGLYTVPMLGDKSGVFRALGANYSNWSPGGVATTYRAMVRWE